VPASIRYLSAIDVTACMPAVGERLRLAGRAMTALVNDADLPPKIGVHPRTAGSFAHAMPASIRPPGGESPGGDDLLGMKWVTGFAGDPARGIPAIHAVVILNDPSSGEVQAILDGGPITAERTAAVSGVAISRFGPADARSVQPDGAPPVRAAIIGAGIQGHSHLPVLGHLLPGVHLRVHDRHSERAIALAAAAGRTTGIAEATAVTTAREAAADADVVVTAVSFTEPALRGALTLDWLAPGALVVAVDYATMVSPAVAREAALFMVDERGQFVVNRDAGQFDGYPDPAMTLGEAILGEIARPPAGRVLVTHLGVGVADVVFADAVLRQAEALGLGTMLAN